MLPKPVAVGEKKASGQQKGRDDVKHENSGRHFDVKKFEIKIRDRRLSDLEGTR